MVNIWRTKRLCIIFWNPIPVDDGRDYDKNSCSDWRGAAGMMAAVQAARAGARVTIYERNDRIGKKILSTGNGKCNFSNEKMDISCYHGSGRELIPVLYETFGVAETKRFLRISGCGSKK